MFGWFALNETCALKMVNSTESNKDYFQVCAFVADLILAGAHIKLPLARVHTINSWAKTKIHYAAKGVSCF